MAKVLLVSDNSKYLKDALPFYGYEVLNSQDGIQALRILKNNDVDIILLDVMMPSMEGCQTLKAVRKMYRYIPVIMLTAVNDEQKMIAGLKAGADDYIIKPFILPNLLARMEAVIRRTNANSKTKISLEDKLKFLTAKEKEVIQLAAQGYSNKEIADKLVVKEVTVKTHLNSVFKKLNVTNRTQAVLVAMQTEV